MFLARLPKMIQAYGKSFAGLSGEARAVVVLVCDLDDRCQKDFRQEISGYYRRGIAQAGNSNLFRH